MPGRGRCAVHGPGSTVGTSDSVGTSRRCQSCLPFSQARRQPDRSWWPGRNAVGSSCGTVRKTGVSSLQFVCFEYHLSLDILSRMMDTSFFSFFAFFFFFFFLCLGCASLALRGVSAGSIRLPRRIRKRVTAKILNKINMKQKGNVTCLRINLFLDGLGETFGAGRKGRQGRAGVQSGTGL